MSEMIERVAKALYDNMCLANPHVMTTWETLSWDLKSYYSEQARAAIEAMHNPTRNMVHAALECDGPPSINWQAMIEAALTSPDRATNSEQERQ